MSGEHSYFPPFIFRQPFRDVVTPRSSINKKWQKMEGGKWRRKKVNRIQ